MNELSPKIFLLPFPQFLEINGTATLTCNLLLMPRFDPLKPLDAGLGAFAETPLRLRAKVFKGDTQGLPVLDNVPANAIVHHNIINLATNRTNLFNSIASHFTIKDDKQRTFQQGSIYKYLSVEYRNSFNFNKVATPFAKTDDSYFCMLKQTTSLETPYVPNNLVNWAQVMAFCLQHQRLAEKLGLLHQKLVIHIEDPAFFKDGGWIYFEFEETDEDNTFDKLASAELQRYAAYIPAATTSRHLFAPVVFPMVAKGEGTQTFDGAFRDLIHYDDGFARIVHASQAVSIDHFAEQYNGNPPVTDTGIRLGWDEEQILIWLNNSMKAKVPVGGIDPPPGPVLGVGRYRLDVKLIDPDDPQDWKSQVSVIVSPVELANIQLEGFKGELGIEVSPVKHNGSADFWLPVYFTNWDGTSLCVRDEQTAVIRQMTIHEAHLNEKLGIEPPAPVAANPLYKPDPKDTLDLQYGKSYAFRVRLSDLTGGGPAKDDPFINTGVHNVARCDFKRHVAPQPPVITKIADDSLQISRARLTYPAITFTGEDKATVLTELQADMSALESIYADIKNELASAVPDLQKVSTLRKTAGREPSLPDPDIDKIEIVVEVKTLDMDLEASYNAVEKIYPKESFILLYTTTRNYPEYHLNHAPANDVIDLKLAFQDIPVINFNDPLQLGLTGDLFLGKGPLLLPSGREIRLTVRSYCKTASDTYFAGEAYRFSTPSKITVRKDPQRIEAAALLAAPAGIDPLVSFYFRPIPKPTPQELKAAASGGKGMQLAIDILQRLAAETSLVCRDLSISGKENTRTQFGCSSLLGYTLAPDASSVTFASKEELLFKWIHAIQFDLQRDWTWDLLQPAGFTVWRRWRYANDPVELSAQPATIVGNITLCKGLNWQKMYSPDRSVTRLVFIDAIDPKQPTKADGTKSFPELLEAAYYLVPQFITGIPAALTPLEADLDANAAITLPITIAPEQVPEIVSVGLALTPEDDDTTLFNNQYSETSNRRRYLWIEFAAPVLDANDAYFARVLAYAADPMLADLPPDTAPEKEVPEPALNIDAEIVRAIRPAQVQDSSGLEAMQLMIPAAVPDGVAPVHYLVPLPDHITPESIELFGFFTYEIAVGHLKKWSTANARFGRPLRITGLQHPAPAMQVSTIRENDAVLVSAGYAQSYQDGRNCTPQTPRTDIFALLYAQVMQADGKHFRNVLISQRMLLKPIFERDPQRLLALKAIQERAHFAITGVPAPYILPQGDMPQGNTFWHMKDVRILLLRLGIDINAPLSVMTIELMPPNDHVDYTNARHLGSGFSSNGDGELALDKVRILRTSRLCKLSDSCPVSS